MIPDQPLRSWIWHRLWIITCCLACTQTYASTPLVNPIARKGVLDARQIDLTKHEINLAGTWLWTWGELRSPDSAAGNVEYISFPQLWSHSTWQGKTTPSQGFATYQLTVLLPKNSDPLALSLPDMYSAYRLFANGIEIAHDGIPGTSKTTTTPYWSTQVKQLPHGIDSVVLVLQVANFHHTKGGPYKQITLGSLNQLQFDWNRNLGLDFLLTGCLFMGGLFFLGLYLFGRHDKSILYFALFCVLYSYRIMGTNQYAFHTLFPDMSWHLAIHLEYLSLYFGIGAFVMYTWALYPKDVYSVLMRVMAGVCVMLGLLTIILPPTIYTQFIDLFLWLMFGYLIYAWWVYMVAARNHRPGAEYALMSTAVLLIVFLFILLDYFGVMTPQKWILFFGYISFFFLQSLILSFRFTSALQRAKVEAEEGLRVKSEFMSTMSHEIRTPLNAVMGMTHLLSQNNPRTDQQPHLDALQFSANNLLKIVNDILDFNKIEAGKITFDAIPTDITQLVQDVQAGYQSFAQTKGIDLRIAIDPALKRKVIGDPVRTTQILINLVHNAIKFTEKGWVEIQVAIERQTDKTIDLTIAVKDTGIGIAPEKQAMIFNDFTQADSSMSRNYGGTGLGLTISKRLLALQGVQLHIKSVADEGSTFYFTQTFTLVDEPPKPPKPRPAAVDGKPLAGISILIVEDNLMNVLLAEAVLKQFGASTDVAENGQIALDMLDSSRHDLILMDLQMPVMDGYEATMALRARGETLPIIALTASMPEEVGEKIRTTGLDDIVVKPFVPKDLLRVILSYLNKA